MCRCTDTCEDVAPLALAARFVVFSEMLMPDQGGTKVLVHFVATLAPGSVNLNPFCSVVQLFTFAQHPHCLRRRGRSRSISMHSCNTKNILRHSCFVELAHSFLNSRQAETSDGNAEDTSWRVDFADYCPLAPSAERIRAHGRMKEAAAHSRGSSKNRHSWTQ